jgi:hypothetical protein
MYTVVIDESGDVGLHNVQPDPSDGPTQYFCMAATFFREINRRQIESELSSLPFKKKILHANKLSHFEKVALCKTISKLPIAVTGVVSNKLTLLDYLDDAKRTLTHFYNKVMQYLLERVGDVMGAYGIRRDQVRIVLEARQQRYSSLLSFVDSIQKNPLDLRSLPIRNLDRFSISTVKKVDEPCMALSDIAAHSLFCAVRRDSKAFGFSETRYLHELRPVIVADKNGIVVPKGIKLIHSVKDAMLPAEEAQFFRSLTNPNPHFHRLRN